jgi:restriction system protein
MAIPNYQAVMLPLLRYTGDGNEHSLREVIDAMADEFRLTEEQRRQLLPSGGQPTWDNRVGWARTYLKKAGLLEYTRRAYTRITEQGKEVLSQEPSEIDVAFLKQFPEFREFRARRRQRVELEEEADTGSTPEESLEAAYEKIQDDLAADLVDAVLSCSPSFFERLVLDLLVKMGYGGTRKDAAEAVGGTGDGGIDGIIKEDRLGLDVVYIQAKRWADPVGRPEVQKFAGALQGHRAAKGIFITTSDFTRKARQFVSQIGSKIVLIDGETLAQLMIDHNIGVATETTYEIKRIDSDYFIDA